MSDSTYEKAYKKMLEFELRIAKQRRYRAAFRRKFKPIRRGTRWMGAERVCPVFKDYEGLR